MRESCVSVSRRKRRWAPLIEAIEPRLLMAGSGLIAQYYNTANLTGTAILRNDATVNFNWGNGAPDNALNPNGYSAQWTGQVQASYTETYTFSIAAQGGGARLVVNGTTLIDQLSATGGTWNGTIALTAGTKYSITVQYSEKSTSNSGISLSWSSAHQAQQVIPQAQLYDFVDTDASTNYAGSSSYDPATGVLTVKGGSKTQDWIVPNRIGHFVTQTITGDVQIVARLTSAGANAYAGITIQDGFSFGATALRAYRASNGVVYTGGYDRAGAIALPVWLKVIRIGNVFTAYTSRDGVAWEIAPSGTGQTLSTSAALNVGFFVASNYLNSSTLETATFDNISITSPKLDYITSYVGNTGSGINNSHVQNDIKGMYVAPDGTVYANSPYDEGGYEAAVYKNGQIVGSLLDTNGSFGSLHGWSRSGGWGIGVDDNYIYITMGQGYLGYDQTGYPTSGSGWNCIRRYSRSTLRAAPFTNGVIDGSAVVVNTNGGALRGLWVSGTEIYVSDKDANTVHIFNSATMTLTRSFAVPSPQQIVEDGSGNLWIISNPSSGTPSVLCYSKAGVLQSRSITDVPVPTSVYYNPATGQLLVADDGPSQQIIKYNISGATPTRAGTLGDYGGISAGTAGQVTATKFDNPMTVGADAAGNIYVGFNGIRPAVTSAIGIGQVLRSLTPSATLNWEVHGLEFVDSAVIDPTSDGLTLFTKDEQWALNYDTTSGEMGTWVGRTVDELVYTADGRVTGGDTNVLMQVINGQKFMFTTGQSGGGWNIYKQVAGTYLWKLCGGVYPSWTWHDLNNNASYDSGEGANNSIVGEVYSSYIDSQNNVWFVGFNIGVYKATFTGLDANGNPAYNANYAKSTVSTDYWNVGRVIYVPETDTMYRMGFTSAYPNPGEDPRGAGCVLTRYDHWTTNPTMTWRYVMPTDRTSDDVSGGNVVNSISLAGNRLFVSVVGTASSYAIDTTTGQLVTVLYRGPEIGGQGGWLDNIQGMTAFRRSNGEYVVLSEDDLLSKVIIYRAGGITPTNLTATSPAQGQVSLSWTDNCNRESGFVLQQSTDGVNYTNVATLPANMTTCTLTGLQGGFTYRFRIKATNAFDDSPYSTVASAYLAPLPNQVVGLTATAAGTSQINLAWSALSGATSYNIYRSTTPGGEGTTPYRTGITSTSYSDTGLAPGSTYYYTVSAVISGSTNPQSLEATATTQKVVTIPAPWSQSDIGSPSIAGSGQLDLTNGQYAVGGSGADIWDYADQFHYVYQPITGNGSITARVIGLSNTNAWAKAGVMFRDSLAAGAMHASMFATVSNGPAFQYRSTTGGISSHVTGGSTSAPIWVRMVRAGNVFTAYWSNDGSAWTQVGSATIAMGTTIYVGMAVTSHDNAQLCSASIDGVTAAFSPAAAPTGVTLNAASDTGVSGDNLTNLNNSSSARKLSFTVAGTLSGATVSLYAGSTLIGSAIASGTTTTVTTDGATTLPDGISSITAKQTATGLSASSASPALSLTIDTAAPRVNGVSVSGSAWSQAFLDYLSSHSLGAAGYLIPAGANQLKNLPWTNLNQLKIAFGENVTVNQGSLALRGVNKATYDFSAFAYDAASLRATWTLSSVFSADKLLADLSDTVTDLAGNALDGEWTTGQASYPSGNGSPGGHLQFRFNVLPGDVDGNGVVLSNDVNAIRLLQFQRSTDAAYQFFADLDGNGVILSNDVNAARLLQFVRLPLADPV